MSRDPKTQPSTPRNLASALQRLVPPIYSAAVERPFVKGSFFKFDSTGCIHRPTEVFEAMMEGLLNEQEMQAIMYHKMVCWKCNETFAALRLQFERRIMTETRQAGRERRSKQQSSEDGFRARQTQLHKRIIHLAIRGQRHSTNAMHRKPCAHRILHICS